MSSAICFNLYQFKILSSGNGLKGLLCPFQNKCDCVVKDFRKRTLFLDFPQFHSANKLPGVWRTLLACEVVDWGFHQFLLGQFL